MNDSELVFDEILDYEFDEPNSEYSSESEDSDVPIEPCAFKGIKLNRNFIQVPLSAGNGRYWNSKFRKTTSLAMVRIRALDSIFMPQRSIVGRKKSLKHSTSQCPSPKMKTLDIVIVRTNMEQSNPTSSSSVQNETWNILKNVCPNFKNFLNCDDLICDNLHELPPHFLEELFLLSSGDFYKFYSYIKRTRLFILAAPHLVSYVANFCDTDSLFKIILDLLRTDPPKLVSIVILELMKKECSPLEIIKYLIHNCYSDRMLEIMLEIFSYDHDNLHHFWQAIIEIFRCKSLPFNVRVINDLLAKVNVTQFKRQFLEDIQYEVIDKCLVDVLALDHLIDDY